MTEPRSTRPRIPETYGVSSRSEGMLEWEWAVQRLEKAHNYWLCTTREDGRPHAMPVWAVWTKGAAYFSTGRTTLKARNLARDPRLSLHLESGDQVVILEGIAEEVAEAEVEDLLERYRAKYGIDPPLTDPGTVTYRLRPRVALGWREKDFPESATRWVWDPDQSS